VVPRQTKRPYVAYYRVSTDRQGRSGLGLDAQRAAVQEFLNRSEGKLRAEFTEVQSGKDDTRAQLTDALKLCKLTNSTLLIAKLDRLSRNVAFLATLQQSSTKFVACDLPEANELVVHILAAVAQAERKAISERTKSALAAARARGVRLGNPRLGPGNAVSAAIARKARIVKTNVI
jgi:DNA invertase Pin-like site-specific DNA recombinase